jgi:hypothetical protein
MRVAVQKPPATTATDADKNAVAIANANNDGHTLSTSDEQ